MKLRLYHYWRSSSSWRVRWAFALKGISCEFVAVDLLSGESESEGHRKRNPFGYVPVLEFLQVGKQDNVPRFLSESMAIIEWADETHPSPPLLPGDAYERAWIRQLAEVINADTQPLQNLGPQYLHSDDPEKRKRWAQHWVRTGLEAYEALVVESAGKFSVGDQLTLADLCLVPQFANAKRYDVSYDTFPTVTRICEEALKTEACLASSPERFKPPGA
jgi:maleylacetoacetate isomerase